MLASLRSAATSSGPRLKRCEGSEVATLQTRKSMAGRGTGNARRESQAKLSVSEGEGGGQEGLRELGERGGDMAGPDRKTLLELQEFGF